MSVLSKLDHFPLIPVDLQDEILCLLLPKDLLSVSLSSKSTKVLAQRHLLKCIVFRTEKSLINFVPELTEAKARDIRMLHFYPPALQRAALILLVKTAPYLIELELLESMETSLATDALELWYPNMRRLTLVADHGVLTDRLPTFLAGLQLLEDLRIFPILSSNVPTSASVVDLPALKSIACPMMWLPVFFGSGATTLRVDNLANSDVANISGRLSKSALGATLVSLHVTGDVNDITIFLAPVARACTCLIEILLYGSTARPNIDEIFAVLQHARTLVRFDYNFNPIYTFACSSSAIGKTVSYTAAHTPVFHVHNENLWNS
ncbi:hypothetical protein B0H11DRAFT_2280970 [Mycena galericulata]|nr:hypothetical protein B0H11DRAFT_2280970 [Mycena galericulata]